MLPEPINYFFFSDRCFNLCLGGVSHLPLWTPLFAPPYIYSPLYPLFEPPFPPLPLSLPPIFLHFPPFSSSVFLGVSPPLSPPGLFPGAAQGGRRTSGSWHHSRGRAGLGLRGRFPPLATGATKCHRGLARALAGSPGGCVAPATCWGAEGHGGRKRWRVSRMVEYGPVLPQGSHPARAGSRPGVALALVAGPGLSPPSTGGSSARAASSPSLPVGQRVPVPRSPPCPSPCPL